MKYARITFAILAALRVSASAYGQQAHPPVVNARPAWAQLAKLTSSQLYPYGVGYSVAISGNVIVVGAPYGQFVSLYVMPPSGWGSMVETAILTASDEPLCGSFGWSVAIVGKTVVVGDPSTYCPPQTGAAYVYVEPAAGWSGTLTENAKLTASDAVSGDSVGNSVAVAGTSIVAGAPYQASGLGAAYVFTEPPGGWVNATQTAKLTPSDGLAMEDFGLSVSASGNVIVAGAPNRMIGANQYQGTAYVYVEPSGGWSNATQTAELNSSPQQPGYMAASVSVSGPVIVAGDSYQCAAYVFVEPSSGWVNMTQTAMLTESAGNTGDELGASVAVDGNFIAVGAPRYNGKPNTPFWEEGAAFIFAKPAGGWMNATETSRVTGSDARFEAFLGTSVAVSRGTVVPAALFSGRRNLGAAYVFDRFTGQ